VFGWPFKIAAKEERPHRPDPLEEDAMPEAPPVHIPRQPVTTARAKRTTARDILAGLQRESDPGMQAILRGRDERIEEGKAIAREGQRVFVDMMPVVSDAVDLKEAITGRDAVTGETLSVGQRVMQGGGAVLSAIPFVGKFFDAGKAGKSATHSNAHEITSPIAPGFTPISPRDTAKRGSYFVSVATSVKSSHVYDRLAVCIQQPFSVLGPKGPHSPCRVP
jgi:hypothetical protein